MHCALQGFIEQWVQLPEQQTYTIIQHRIQIFIVQENAFSCCNLIYLMTTTQSVMSML
jgi:hypothetical protein